MGTVFTPPIDLYAQDEGDETRASYDTPADIQASPRENGDLDDPALRAGELRLEQVLGW